MSGTIIVLRAYHGYKDTQQHSSAHSNGPLRAQVHLDVGNVIMIRDDLTLFLWQIELFMVQPLGVILYIDVAVTGAKKCAPRKFHHFKL